MMNRFQKAQMKKRNNLIMGYVKRGLTYKQIAEIILRHHKIKLTVQRIGKIAKDYENEEFTRPQTQAVPDIQE